MPTGSRSRPRVAMLLVTGNPKALRLFESRYGGNGLAVTTPETSIRAKDVSPRPKFVTISQHAHNTGRPPVTATRAPER
jgi:hypothetical protein